MLGPLKTPVSCTACTACLKPPLSPPTPLPLSPSLPLSISPSQHTCRIPLFSSPLDMPAPPQNQGPVLAWPLLAGLVALGALGAAAAAGLVPHTPSPTALYAAPATATAHEAVGATHRFMAAPSLRGGRQPVSAAAASRPMADAAARVQSVALHSSQSAAPTEPATPAAGPAALCGVLVLAALTLYRWARAPSPSALPLLPPLSAAPVPAPRPLRKAHHLHQSPAPPNPHLETAHQAPRNAVTSGPRGT